MLFLSDLDGTLHGTTTDAQNGLSAWRTFWQASEKPLGSVLCYNTGRCISDYLSVLQPELPVPDVLITGDGTEIRWCTDDARESAEFSLDEEWSRLVDTRWQLVRERLLRRMNEDDEGHIADLNAVANSPPRGEARWAITVRSEDKARALAAAYAAEFAPNVSVYIMAGWSQPKSYLVVALPASCGKANAARYVQHKLGFRDAACVGAGDSENDLPMVSNGKPFIMVANAVAGLAKAVQAADRADVHFCAAASYASGVVEGLAHFRRRLDEQGGSD